MNTKQLIEELQKVDPSGEIPVCIGNSEILFLEKVPGYYDGYLERLVFKDGSRGNVGQIIGAKLVASKDKIRLVPYSIDSALLDNIDLPVEVDGEPNGGYHTDWVERLRKENREIIESVRGK